MLKDKKFFSFVLFLNKRDIIEFLKNELDITVESVAFNKIFLFWLFWGVKTHL